MTDAHSDFLAPIELTREAAADEAQTTIRAVVADVLDIALAMNRLGLPAGRLLVDAVEAIEQANREITAYRNQAAYSRFKQAEEATHNMMRAVLAIVATKSMAP